MNSDDLDVLDINIQTNVDYYDRIEIILIVKMYNDLFATLLHLKEERLATISEKREKGFITNSMATEHSLPSIRTRIEDLKVKYVDELSRTSPHIDLEKVKEGLVDLDFKINKVEKIYVHDPQNENMMEEVYVFCSVDEDGEGILGATINGLSNGSFIPLVTASKHMLPILKSAAIRVSKLSEKKIILKKFTNAETLETISEGINE